MVKHSTIIVFYAIIFLVLVNQILAWKLWLFPNFALCSLFVRYFSLGNHEKVYERTVRCDITAFAMRKS